VESCVTAIGALTDRPAAILLLNERDGIEDSQMDCACDMHGEGNKYRILWENLKQGGHLKDLKFDGSLNVKKVTFSLSKP